MDSITQGLLGATVAECGFRHKLGRGATLMGAIAGVLPDLDIFVGWIDPWLSWQYHRHFTHSVFFALLVAVPLAWLFWRRRRNNLAWWVLCAYLALATHPLLDLCTSYGTHLFVPLSRVRLGLDWIAIIDPIYSVILIAAVVACALLRRRGRSTKTWPVGAGGIVLSTGYLLYGAMNHGVALSRVHDHAHDDGHHVLAARAIPQVGSVYVWRLIYRTDEAFYVGRTNTRFDRPPEFIRLPVQDHPLIRKADELPRIRLFRDFTMGWARPRLTQYRSDPAVVYDDMRYAWPPDSPDSLWSAMVVFDRNGSVLAVHATGRRDGSNRRTVGSLWREFWREIGRP